MDSDVLGLLAPALAFVAIAVAAALVRSRLLTPTARIRRAMARTPLVEVARAPEGERVRLTGVVRVAGAPLAAPVSGSSCVVYDVVVKVVGSRAAVALDRGVVLHESEVVDFFLEDPTGRALVRAETAEVLLTPRISAAPRPGHGQGGAVARFLEERRVRARGRLGLDRRLRCDEGALRVGARVTVVGVPRREARDGEALCVLEGVDGGPELLVADDPRRGE